MILSKGLKEEILIRLHILKYLIILRLFKDNFSKEFI